MTCSGWGGFSSVGSDPGSSLDFEDSCATPEKSRGSFATG